MNVHFNKKLTKTKIALVASFGLCFTHVDATDMTEVIVSTKAVTGGTFYPSLQSVALGKQATILITAQAGYKLKAIQGCGGRYENQLFIIPKATYSCTVTAEFSPIPNKQTSLNEQATASPKTITTNNSTSPEPGNGALPSKKLKLLLMADYVTNYVTANAVVSSGSGTVTPASQRVRKGSTATFAITPAQGYVVTSASGCGIREAGSGNISTPALPENCTITVQFAVPQRNLWDQFNWDNANWG